METDREATALYSFDPFKFGLFLLAFYIIPYPVYRFIAHRLKWETNQKTMSRHWSDLFDGISYGLILFIFGNYSNTLSWITVAAFYPSLFGYALIAELPFTKTSLPNIRNWPKGMWAVFLTAVAIILVFAGYHIYLGYLLPMPFVIYYVSCLSIPAAILASSFLLSKEHQEQADEGTTLLPVAAAPQNVHNPYTRQVAIHLHHWQIFYVLAFFTRFDHPVSQVGAGIVLACYMEGICAYGYDRLVNDG
ncbi:Casein kinase II subunit alpha [Mucor velutinosus]|uniref:Casein kinase II subunit alpha n=1 Tax=Mucor velutinosus TaxID=708070 RepID=A0AAN7I460_9FUNG|nr:Casein kinase II subunit alpha [Mucor velutinosus]